MGLQSERQPTAAETAMVQIFSDGVGTLPGDAQLISTRDKALARVTKSGLPTRRVEAWHYSDLRSLLREFNDIAPKPQAGNVNEAVSDDASLVEACRLVLVDGYFSRGHSDVLPRGVELNSFLNSVENGDDVSSWFDNSARDGDVIANLNCAFSRDGLALNIEAETQVEQPIELAHIIHDATKFNAPIHQIDVGKSSKVTFIERHKNVFDEGKSQSCPVVHLNAQEGSDVSWVIMQSSANDATHLGQINIKIEKDAKVTLLIMNAGGAVVRQEIHAQVLGEGSDFQMRCVNLLAGKTHCDVTMVLDHLPENTTSEQVVRNVVMDRAKGVFQGQIRVAKEAQKTDARMACNTLLLSDDGEFCTKPELEIFADDVACGHGATVTEIEHDHLFYLMSRGIPEIPARGLLIRAFLAEVIEEFDNEALIEAMEQKLDLWFEQHQEYATNDPRI